MEQLGGEICSPITALLTRALETSKLGSDTCGMVMNQNLRQMFETDTTCEIRVRLLRPAVTAMLLIGRLQIYD